MKLEALNTLLATYDAKKGTGRKLLGDAPQIQALREWIKSLQITDEIELTFRDFKNSEQRSKCGDLDAYMAGDSEGARVFKAWEEADKSVAGSLEGAPATGVEGQITAIADNLLTVLKAGQDALAALNSAKMAALALTGAASEKAAEVLATMSAVSTAFMAFFPQGGSSSGAAPAAAASAETTEVPGDGDGSGAAAPTASTNEPGKDGDGASPAPYVG